MERHVRQPGPLPQQAEPGGERGRASAQLTTASRSRRVPPERPPQQLPLPNFAVPAASSSNDRQRSRWRRRSSSDNNNRRHLSRRRRRRQTTAMETAAAPTTAARSTSSVTATAAPPAATTAATTAASTAAAQERSRLVTAHRGRATWCSRAKTAASTPPAAVSHRTRETERETRKLNGECSVVGGPSGVSTGRQKPRSVAP